MSGINKILLLGRVNGTPVFSALPKQTILRLELITEEQFLKNEIVMPHNEHHQVVLYGLLAEAGHQALEDGDYIYLEGRIETKPHYIDSVKMYKTEINGLSFKKVYNK